MGHEDVDGRALEAGGTSYRSHTAPSNRAHRFLADHGPRESPAAMQDNRIPVRGSVSW